MKTFQRDGGLKAEQTMGVYEFLANKRILFLYGAIVGFPSRPDVFNSSSLCDYLLALDREDPKTPIWLIIDSGGGLIDDGLSVYDTIQSLHSPVYTVGRSCQSMAAFLLAAGAPGHRYVYPHARIMLHLPSGSMEGDSVQMETQTKEIVKLKRVLINILIKHGAKKTQAQILADINKKRDFWLTAEETIAYGLADSIVPKGLFNDMEDLTFKEIT